MSNWIKTLFGGRNTKTPTGGYSDSAYPVFTPDPVTQQLINSQTNSTLGSDISNSISDSFNNLFSNFGQKLSDAAKWTGQNILQPLLNPGYEQNQANWEREQALAERTLYDQEHSMEIAASDAQAAGFSKWSLVGSNGGSYGVSQPSAVTSNSINPGSIMDLLNAINNVKNGVSQRKVMSSEVDKAKAEVDRITSEADYYRALADSERHGSWFNNRQADNFDATVAELAETNRIRNDELEETKSHNAAQDVIADMSRQETERHNKAIEAETTRHNTTSEYNDVLHTNVDAAAKEFDFALQRYFGTISTSQKERELALAEQKFQEDKQVHAAALELQARGMDLDKAKLIVSGVFDFVKLGIDWAKFKTLLGF